MKSRPVLTHMKITLSACALAALASLLPKAHASSITAYRDPSGRVVFVNEAAPVLVTEPAAPLPEDAGAPSTPAASVSSQPARRNSVITAFRRSWDELIDSVATRHRVDPALVRAIVRVESNYNPMAVSSRGAKGLMQLIPATARRFGVSNAFDPKANLDAGVRYLKYLMNMFNGDLRLSLAAYNAGENAVTGHNGVPPFPETRDYLRKISELYPLSSAAGQSTATEQTIGRYRDGDGVVHFTNTDMR
jgi:soluble lytic murein transglycosylase-like protein